MKIWEEYLRSEESQPHARKPNPGFQCQEDKYPYLLATKTSRDLVSGKNFWSPKQFLLKNPHTDLIRLTPGKFQHRGSSLKGTSGIGGRTEV